MDTGKFLTELRNINSEGFGKQIRKTIEISSVFALIGGVAGYVYNKNVILYAACTGIAAGIVYQFIPKQT